jgi:hypothetical protein
MSDEKKEEIETIGFNLSSALCLSFRKKCLDRGQTYSEAIEGLMKEYINRRGD